MGRRYWWAMLASLFLFAQGLSVAAAPLRQCPYRLIGPEDDPVTALKKHFAASNPAAGSSQQVYTAPTGQAGYLQSFNPNTLNGAPTMSAPEMRRVILDLLQNGGLGKLHALQAADLAQMSAIARSDPQIQGRFNPVIRPHPTMPRRWVMQNNDEGLVLESEQISPEADKAFAFPAPLAIADIAKFIKDLLDIRGLVIPRTDWNGDAPPLTPPSGPPIIEALLPNPGTPYDMGARVRRCLDPMPGRSESAAAAARKAISNNGHGPLLLQRAIPDGIKPRLESSDFSQSAISFINTIANFDQCCFDTIDPSLSPLLKKVLENTGALLRRQKGTYIAIATATILESRILLTARHAIYDANRRIPDEELFFSPNIAPSERISIRSDINLNALAFRDDASNDYALLFAPDLKVGSGIPLRHNNPTLHEDLMIYGFTLPVYQLEGLAAWASGSVNRNRPAWNAAMRMDAGGQCKVVSTIKHQNIQQRCFVHGCQAEAGTSGAPLFVVESQDGKSALKIAGIHLGGASASTNKCAPERTGGNMGIVLPTSVNSDIAEGRRKYLQVSSSN